MALYAGKWLNYTALIPLQLPRWGAAGQGCCPSRRCIDTGSFLWLCWLKRENTLTGQHTDRWPMFTHYCAPSVENGGSLVKKKLQIGASPLSTILVSSTKNKHSPSQPWCCCVVVSGHVCCSGRATQGFLFENKMSMWKRPTQSHEQEQITIILGCRTTLVSQMRTIQSLLNSLKLVLICLYAKYANILSELGRWHIVIAWK